MQSALTSQLIVVGNSTLLETIKETIQEVLPELRKWEKAEDIDPVTIGICGAKCPMSASIITGISKSPIACQTASL